MSRPGIAQKFDNTLRRETTTRRFTFNANPEVFELFVAPLIAWFVTDGYMLCRANAGSQTCISIVIEFLTTSILFAVELVTTVTA